MDYEPHRKNDRLKLRQDLSYAWFSVTDVLVDHPDSEPDLDEFPHDEDVPRQKWEVALGEVEAKGIKPLKKTSGVTDVYEVRRPKVVGQPRTSDLIQIGRSCVKPE